MVNVLTTCKVKSSIKTHFEEQFPDVYFNWQESIDEARNHLSEADILITYGEDLIADDIVKAERLSWIMVISAGLDKMPFDQIEAQGIKVTNARGIHAIPMAEYVIAMILQVSRQAKKLMDLEEEHKWDRSVKMTEITGGTMLIVGTGAIGQEVARLAKGFRMKTVGISQSGQLKDHFDECHPNESLHDYLPEADYVIGILPATDETHHYFDSEEFSAMKETAIFLNMGRGQTVNESAIVQSLKDGDFYHAVLDVFEEEPLDDQSPLWDLEQCTVTPHLSGISRHYQPRAFDIFETNLKSYLESGQLVENVIDPDRGY
ncbi:D-2-hydroxyacid dehydrogenase [Alkalibacillus almallahensis]|uniref:D-2-hydroxyacid dehydrogenase n=1 Tax=Alkalibacillus almallahensis TaxID=1379154 RepID=UPI001ABB7408|nr:D-2-hydroxyacid dehydrogenase [Alkalibacillus almallahensis]NIK11565.1 phosphoglycerate dehydrogenase-like enzyme [Alkalibacillus almallahensis]